MATADANQTRIVFKAEAVFNEAFTPPVATMIQLRFDKESLEVKNANVLSNEIVATRTRVDQLLVAQGIQGTIDAELTWGTYDAFIEAVTGGAWTANVVTNGVTVLKSFLMEKGFIDIAQYIQFSGMTVDSVSFDITSKQIIMISVAFQGARPALSTTSCAAPGTLVAPNTNTIMTAATNVASLLVDGASAGKVRSLKFQIKANERERDYIGALYTDAFGRGFVEVAGTLEVFFADVVLLTKFLANTSFALATTFGGVSTLKYAVVLPKCKVGSAPVNITGVNTDVMATFSFNAFFDTASGYLIQITRTP